MDSLSKQIEKLREKENKLRDEKRKLLQLLADGIFTKEEYGKEKASTEAQIAETQKEIQAKEAELKEMTKKFEEATQAMETEESGAGDELSLCKLSIVVIFGVI